MRIFITGISGLLGLNLALQLREEFEAGGGYHRHPIDLEGVHAVPTDLTSLRSTMDAISNFRPDVVVHTAAYTDVDGCETNPDLARSLNVDAAINAAKVTAKLGAKLVHISTDHLFDGAKPWRTEDDLPDPLNVYAATKWEGEQMALRYCPGALVIRTNFFGWGSPIKDSFSDWILKALRDDQQLSMFVDAFFTPILVNDLVDLLAELIRRQVGGVHHVAGRDRLSKYSFAVQLAEAFGYSAAKINQVPLMGHQPDVKRPEDMSLASGKLERLIKKQVPTVAEGLSRLRLLEEEGWPEQLRRAIGSTPVDRRPMPA